MSETVHLEVTGHLAVITLDHPPMNTLSREIVRQLGEIITELSLNDRLRAVIVTGACEKSFCAGAEISEIPEMRQQEGRRTSARGQHTLKNLGELPCPVIAAINGYALGGGCELAMACDIRVAAENAILGLPEVKLGLLPGYGGTQRLPRLVPGGTARMLLFTGDTVNAAEAYRVGLVDVVVPPGEALAAAQQLAEKIMANGPLAVRAVKKVLVNGLGYPLEQGLAWEAYVFGELCESEDKVEGTRAFLEKRPPQFQGR